MTPDGRRAISGARDGTMKLWDMENGRELLTFPSLSYQVAITADGRRAVSASNDGMLKVWEIESGRQLCTLQPHSDLVHGVAITPNGRRVVSAYDDGTLKVWDAESGEVLSTSALEGAAFCCAFANHSTIIAGDERGRIYLYKVEE